MTLGLTSWVTACFLSLAILSFLRASSEVASATSGYSLL